MKKVVLVAVSSLLLSCGAAVTSDFGNSKKSLSGSDPVAFLDVHHEIPKDVEKVGNAKYGDTGFSVDCSLYTNLISARELARKNGANIVKIVKKKAPDMILTTCHRVWVDFYHYNGDVSVLPQYPIE